MRMLYPGSFDPVTNGHMDVIRRAARMCDELVVAVMHNPEKKGFLPVQTRVELIEAACSTLGNVRVVAHGGLMIECAAQENADAVVRGVRPTGDFDSEFQMAQINRMIGGVETVLLPTSPETANISSSIVRQIAAFGGAIDRFVPQDAVAAVMQAAQKEKSGPNGR
ncbi:MAG: pantetheine-phosphate adenylyltransferase [Clostridia bacterium]|nr:pantetheine-phosphate adenylyltransferase [Clostridia bacterium]